MHLITFSLAGREYAATIQQVDRVIRMRDIIPVPDAAHFVEGVINLRDKVVPVINVRKKIGLAAENFSKRNRIIIAHIEDHLVGFIVDYVNDVISVDPGSIEKPDNELKKAKYLMGVGKIEGRLILIADIISLLSDEDRSSIEAVESRFEVKKKG